MSQERMTPAQLRRELGLPPKAGDALEQAVGFLLRPRAPRQHPEDELQAAIVQWLGYSLRPGVLVHHSPNERRDAAEARRMKRAGTMPGWPDLMFVWSDESWHTASGYSDDSVQHWTSRVAFIEVKAPTGSLTPAQRFFRDWCQAGGVPWALVRSLDDAIAAVNEWGLTKGATNR